MTDEDLIADEDVVVTISGRGYIKRQPVDDVPPPAPRRQGDHRPRHPRGGRGRAPARREHPRLGAVLHEPRPRLQRQGPRDPGRQPPGQGHPDHQPAGRPGRVRRGPDGDDHAARTSRPAATSSSRRATGIDQEDAARAVRAASARPASGRSRSTTGDELAWVDVSTGDDDVIIATAQGKIARFHETEVRPMGRDAAGVIGIRLARAGRRRSSSMSVVQPEADLLVLTETGYGKRVPLTEFRRKHRGGQGVRPDRLEGKQDRRRRRASSRSPRRTRSCSSSAPAARSSGPTSTRSTATRPGPRRHRHAARTRATGSSRIAAFRAGLAERDGIGDNDAPRAGRGRPGRGKRRVTAS